MILHYSSQKQRFQLNWRAPPTSAIETRCPKSDERNEVQRAWIRSCAEGSLADRFHKNTSFGVTSGLPVIRPELGNREMQLASLLPEVPDRPGRTSRQCRRQ